MSAKLLEAIVSGKVVAKRKSNISGEVMIQFRDPAIPAIPISGTTELTKYVQANMLRNSNIDNLIKRGFIEIL